MNFQKITEETISKLQSQTKRPTLLLHCCCAPCSSYVLEYLTNFFDITVFFYNPNISPLDEYELRKAELKRLLKEKFFKNNIGVLDCDYEGDAFDDLARGLEDLPEGSLRCEKCYRLRLEKTANAAKKKGFDFFTTTLSVSPYKNAEKLNEIGMSLEENVKVKYLVSDFKKNNGYKRSCELSREFGLYRQNFCGCIYSKNFANKP